ncbi:MAG: Gfo/Idh/MocA family oxidoreductase [candidate division WOR-3 bacterium]
MKRLRVGVIGVGHMGAMHARALSRLPDAELVGVYDVDREKALEIAGRYGTRAFVSLDDLIKESEAVVVATPTNTHLEVCSVVLDAGLHILVEKPLAHDLPSAEEIVRRSEDKGLVLAVGYIERFNPGLLAAAEYIRDPMYIEAMRLAPYNPRGTDVDVITDLMVHDIDIVLMYIKEEPERLTCIGVPVLTQDIDIANARLEFASGRIASLTASRVSMQKMRKVRFFQENTYISVNLLERDLEMVIKREDTILPYFPEVDNTIEPIQAEDRDFVLSVLRGQRPEVSGQDALATTRLAYLLLEDAERRLKTKGG